MSYEVLAIIDVAVSLLILSIVLPIIIYRGRNYDILTIKKLIKKGENIDNYFVEGCKHETEIKELLKQNGYVYKDISVIPEHETVYGLGVVEFKDKTREYNLYFSRVRYCSISEEEYESLKNYIGQTINIHCANYMWTKGD